MFRRRQRLTDLDLVDAGKDHDVAGGGDLRLVPPQAEVGVHLRHARSPLTAVPGEPQNVVAGPQAPATQPTDGQAPDVVVVVQVGDLEQDRSVGIVGGGGEVAQHRLEQRSEVFRAGLAVAPSAPFARDGVDDGEVQLGVAGTELDHQVEGEVDDLVGPGVRAVDLVHDDDRPEAQRQRLLQHEAGLRHRSFGRVDEQQHAVDHLQGALDLATEVGVAGRVHDVDLVAVPCHGGVLGQDGDASLALEGARVHHALGDFLVLAEDAGLTQHAVDEGGLAMVDVSDDGDVSVAHRARFPGTAFAARRRMVAPRGPAPATPADATQRAHACAPPARCRRGARTSGADEDRWIRGPGRPRRPRHRRRRSRSPRATGAPSPGGCP